MKIHMLRRGHRPTHLEMFVRYWPNCTWDTVESRRITTDPTKVTCKKCLKIMQQEKVK